MPGPSAAAAAADRSETAHRTRLQGLEGHSRGCGAAAGLAAQHQPALAQPPAAGPHWASYPKLRTACKRALEVSKVTQGLCRLACRLAAESY